MTLPFDIIIEAAVLEMCREVDINDIPDDLMDEIISTVKTHMVDNAIQVLQLQEIKDRCP
jgi:hypothetical protein